MIIDGLRLPSWLVHELDRDAERNNLSRRAYIKQLLTDMYWSVDRRDEDENEEDGQARRARLNGL